MAPAHAHPNHLRYALRSYLGQILSPEAAAHIEAMALVNPLPVPEAPGGAVCNEQRPEFFEYLADRLDAQFEPTAARVLASLGPDGETRAVVVYANAAPHNIEMAIATDGGRRWFTRGFGYWAYRYPFVQLGKARITVRIRLDNDESIELCTRLGHTHEGVIRRDHGDTDSLVMGMLAQECRWIKEHSCGKEVRAE